MCKYEIDSTSIVEYTKQTRFGLQMDGQSEISIPPLHLRWRGYNHAADQRLCEINEGKLTFQIACLKCETLRLLHDHDDLALITLLC